MPWKERSIENDLTKKHGDFEVRVLIVPQQ